MTLQNMTGNMLEGVKVEWWYVTRYSYYDKKGDKTVDLKPLEKLEFDTDFIDGNYIGLRGHSAKISYNGKTIFEEHNPKSIEKHVKQREKGKEEQPAPRLEEK